MKARSLLILCAAILITSCSERQQADATVVPPSGPLVVYASYEDETYLPDLFAGFTRDTGIRVIVQHANDETNVDGVIENSGSPRADLLLTSTVHGAWRAAEEGALRPLGVDRVRKVVPARMRDPDDYWTAVTFRTAQIAFRSEIFSPDDIGRFDDLAKPMFEGRLCLSSSELAINRAVIAIFTHRNLGSQGERMVRGWMANLAMPPFRSEAALLQAIESRACEVGIVSSSSLNMNESRVAKQGIAAVTPMPAYGNIEAIGIARHAREPEAARQLVEWMLSPSVQSQHSRRTSTFPVNADADGQQASWSGQLGDSNVSVVAIHDEDAVKLAERARYR